MPLIPSLKKRLVHILLSVAAPGLAFAETAMLTEDDLLVEIPMVSSVTHMQQTLPQTPASVTIRAGISDLLRQWQSQGGDIPRAG